jgi:hypothetical protein
MTYYDWQITHSKVMSWVSLTSQNPDTPEELESRLSVRIHRIPVELLHLTKLELRKLYRTQTDFGRAFMLELLLWPSEPRLCIYSTKNELGWTIGS